MSVVSRKAVCHGLILAAFSLFLVACGGSSSSITHNAAHEDQAPLPDHQQVTFLRGVVTSADADSTIIQVGEDQVDVANAPVSENGVIAPDARPKVGQTVNLTVAIDPTDGRFVAQAIDVSVAAKGPIESINTALSTFTLLGQTITYSSTTVYANFPVSGNQLTANMMVAVSGSVTGSGQITATRIEYLGANYSAASGLQVSGIVQNLNATTRTFTIGNLTVNYSLVPVTSTTTLANGGMAFVGSTVLPLNGTLTATELTTSGTTTPPVGSVIDSTVALRGPIDLVNTATSTLSIMGQTVTYTTATQFVNLTGGAFVPAAGNVVKVTATAGTVPGQFSATRVELVSTTYITGTPVQVSGSLQNLNTVQRSFTLGSLNVSYASITNLAFTPTLGMNVTVAANAVPVANTLTATELIQSSTTTTPSIETGIAIKGPIETVNTAASTFTVMGQTVSYSTTTTAFPSTIPSTLVVGYVVRVTAVPGPTGGTFTASRVELVGTSYTPGSAVQVSGTIQNLNAVSRTFSLGFLTVNYSGVTNLSFTPTAGMSVVVGANAAPVANTLTATQLVQGTTTTTPSIETGIAIRGPVETVNTAASTFTVMGQTVTYNTTTVFPSTIPNTLAVAYVVRVTAVPGTTAGTFTASRVELVSTSYTPGSAVQVSGTIQNLNTLSRTFTLGLLTVNYSGATSLAFTPTAGMSVIVGASAVPVANMLNATQLVQGSSTTTPSIEAGITIKGPIEAVNTAANTFTVLGQTVTYSATTTTFPSTIPSTLVVGYVVRVSATQGVTAGTFTASRVELVGTTYIPGTSVQVSGTVQNLNALSRTFTLGSLTVNYASVTNLGFTPAVGMNVVAGALSVPVANVLTATELLSTGTTPGTPGIPAIIDPTASIKGPVDVVNTAASSFSVLGQTVTFNTATQFVTSTGATFVLAAGNVVKVATLPSTVVGQLVASRVELVSTAYVAGTSVQVAGTIQNLSTASRTFTLGSLSVNYSGVTSLTFTPTVGMNVTVAATTLPVGNVFSATAMAASSTTTPPGTIPGVPTQPTIAVVTGTISTVSSAAEFNLTGVTVRVGPATQFVNGSQALLVPGVSVMVTGTLSGGLPNAILDATIIRFAGQPVAGARRIIIRGPIDSIDPISRRLVVMGITVTAPRSSIFVRDDEPDRSVSLAQLAPGMVVTVAGVGTDRQIAATFLALARNNGQSSSDDEDDEVSSRLPAIGAPIIGTVPGTTITGVRAWLWAPLDSATPPMLTAFGVPISTTDTTAFFPSGHRGDPSTPSAFFADAVTGRTVRVEGVYANGAFVATRVCIVSNSIRGSDFAARLNNNEND